MREAVQYLSWLFWFPLVLLVIAALLRGSYRRFPLVFAYTVALFLTAVVEAAAYAGYLSGIQLAHSRARYYWFDEGIRQGLLFALVIGLLYRATKGLPARAVLRVSLVTAAIVFAVTSLLIHYDGHAAIGKWMTPWTRDLDFGSAILDLALWAILINARKYDSEVLMLSGALGIQFTGEAIGHALRNQFPAILLAADTTVVVANLACLYIWWQVFRTSPVRNASVPASSPHS